MPLNGGQTVWPVASGVARRAAVARTDQVGDMVDFAYRAWHAEHYGPGAPQSEMAARIEFDIPHLTETPVDRWMARLRGDR